MTEELFITFVWSALVMTGWGNALPASMEKMTVSKMRMADLESSATGFVYNSQRGQPPSYVQYANHGTGGYYEAPAPIQYVTYRKPEAILHSGSTLISAVPGYDKEGAAYPTGYVVPLLEAPRKEALAPYYIPARVPEQSQRVETVDDEEDEGDEGHSDDDDDDDDDSEVDDGEEGEEDDDDEDEHSSGEDSLSEEQSSHGERGEEGYKNHHKFDNAERGKHLKDKHEGHYSEEGGNKKSQSETAGNYDQHEKTGKTSEGESHGHEAYHKKGHKTTGFHNVYSKDEYKKDTDFYDDDHKSGYYDKHSSSNGRHSAAEGGYEKGDRHTAGHEKNEKGKAGHHDKGHEHSRHKGYTSNEGVDSYHNNHADYTAKSGAEGNKKYGYDHK